MHIFFYTKHVAYGIMVLIAMTLLRILYLAPRIKRYIKPRYCYKTMQSIDHLNLNKPERERGLKLKKVVELYWKKKKETKMRKESALVLFKPSVLNFFEEYYFKVTTSSSYRTLGIVCLHTDTSNGIYFILH